MTLFDVLKAALNSRGWTIPYFARQCDVSAQLAYKWLAEDADARITPSPMSCQKIAAALGLSPDHVLELAGHRRAQSDQPSVVLDPDLAAVSAAWPTLDGGIKHAIRILVGQHPVSAQPGQRVSASTRGRKRGQHGPDGPLAATYRPHRALAFAGA